MAPQLFLGSPAPGSPTSPAGPAAPFQPTPCRPGLAVGDLDNDGWVDAVMVAQNGPLVLFHNVTRGDGVRNRSIWITLRGDDFKPGRCGDDRLANRGRPHAGRDAVRRGELPVSRRPQAAFRPRDGREDRFDRVPMAVGSIRSFHGHRGRPGDPHAGRGGLAGSSGRFQVSIRLEEPIQQKLKKLPIILEAGACGFVRK